MQWHKSGWERVILYQYVEAFPVLLVLLLDILPYFQTIHRCCFLQSLRWCIYTLILRFIALFIAFHPLWISFSSARILPLSPLVPSSLLAAVVTVTSKSVLPPSPEGQICNKTKQLSVLRLPMGSTRRTRPAAQQKGSAEHEETQERVSGLKQMRRGGSGLVSYQRLIYTPRPCLATV